MNTWIIKKVIYSSGSENQNYEEEFFHLPCIEIETNQSIEVFHTFYETEIWGTLGPVKAGDEKLKFSQKQIAANAEIDRAIFIYNKLQEKYYNIEENVKRALMVLSHLIKKRFFSIKTRTIQNHKPLILNKVFSN